MENRPEDRWAAMSGGAAPARRYDPSSEMPEETRPTSGQEGKIIFLERIRAQQALENPIYSGRFEFKITPDNRFINPSCHYQLWKEGNGTFEMRLTLVNLPFAGADLEGLRLTIDQNASAENIAEMIARLINAKLQELSEVRIRQSQTALDQAIRKISEEPRRDLRTKQLTEDSRMILQGVGEEIARAIQKAHA